MEKKDRERKILNETLSLARSRGGESRRNVDRVHGDIKEIESPDFLIDGIYRDSDSLVAVAVEHFRVDQLCERNVKTGCQDSLAAIERGRAAKIQNEWKPESISEAIPQKVLDSIGVGIAKGLEAKFKATYSGYLKSFSDGLEKHLSKIDKYVENVKAVVSPETTVECAFLIELHSDYSDHFLHDGQRCKRPLPGEIMLFDEMVDQLSKLAGKVDYVLLGSCQDLRDEVVDAAIIRPALLRKSLDRNKLLSCCYWGEDRERSLYENVSITPTSSIVGDRIDYSLEHTSRNMPLAERMEICMQWLPAALEAHRAKEPFLATLTMQLLFELFGDVLPARTPITWADMNRALMLLGQEEFDKRTSLFEAKWGFPSS